MKNLLILLLLFSIGCCNSQNETAIISVDYEAMTRGSSIEIKASSELITYKDLDSEKQLKPTKKDWNAIKTLVEKINLSEISGLSPPSEAHTADAALQATLSIHTDHMVYRSQTFDHGNPPKELQKIIEKLFEVAME